jgi:spermidine/putrescine transport system permease protein
MAAAAGPRRSRLKAISLLTGPAYLWLALTVFLPLSVMLYFSFLSDVPFGTRVAELTTENYAAFFEKAFYRTLMLRSFRLGAEVTFFCFLFGFPCAYVLAKTVKGRWREALFLLVILPFWSNALVRIFSWTMVLRGNGVLERFVGATRWCASSPGPWCCAATACWSASSTGWCPITGRSTSCSPTRPSCSDWCTPTSPT